MSGGITSSIDLAEVLFTLFWVFFVILILYLHRESKREGYPLESDRKGVKVQGFPAIPEPKEYLLAHGGTQVSPREEPLQSVAAEPAAPHPGAPLVPTGNPMVDGVGPAAYAQRSDTPDLTLHGKPRVVPMRVDDDFSVDAKDVDPRGMSVAGADGKSVGSVSDLWVDRAEPQIYYLEVALDAEHGGRSALVPFGFASINKGAGRIDVNAIYSHQFADVPALKSPDQITLLEEDKICGYFAGGTLYADASRQEPII